MLSKIKAKNESFIKQTLIEGLGEIGVEVDWGFPVCKIELGSEEGDTYFKMSYVYEMLTGRFSITSKAMKEGKVDNAQIDSELLEYLNNVMKNYTESFFVTANMVRQEEEVLVEEDWFPEGEGEVEIEESEAPMVDVIADEVEPQTLTEA